MFFLDFQSQSSIFFKANLVLSFHLGQGFDQLTKILGPIFSQSLSQVIDSYLSLVL